MLELRNGDFKGPGVQPNSESCDVEGCDTPGRFAIGRGGNFHGASQILNLTKEGIKWQNKRFAFV